MSKFSLNFMDVFGTEFHTLATDENTSVLHLSQQLAEELGYGYIGSRLIGGLFKSESAIPIIYDPKFGILSSEKALNNYEHIKNGASLTYYLFPTSKVTMQDIYLDNNTRMGDVSLFTTIDWAGNWYPVILPLKIVRHDGPLTKIVFLQIKTMLDNQPLPQGWQSTRWQLQNIRTGEQINADTIGDISAKIRHGDMLRLTPKTGNEQNDITILDESQETSPQELDIKVSDDLIDAIHIEQSAPTKIHNCTLDIVQGDISMQNTDAIVNAAKSTLDGGSGVDGAIHQAAGSDLVRASSILAPCPPGKAVLTPGFSLPAKWVIHTVGPVYENGDKGEDHVLAEAYRSSLNIALFSNFESMAFPAISTGIYRFPVEEAAKISLQTISQQLQNHKSANLKLVRFVVFDEEAYQIYSRLLQTV